MKKCRLHWLPIDGERKEGEWDELLRCALDADYPINVPGEGTAKVCEKHAGQIALLTGRANELAEKSVRCTE